MSRTSIEEFTAMAAIPPVGMGGRGVPSNPKQKREKRRPVRAIEAFLGASASPLREDDGEENPEAAAAPEAATEAPAAAPSAPATTAEPAAPKSESAQAAPVQEARATTALMVSRDVVEALAQGKSVTVRGVLLEPMFKPSVAPAGSAPAAAAAPTATESAAQALLRATSITEASAASAEPVDMNAAQPPPAPSTNGKAVSAVFRRWGVS